MDKDQQLRTAHETIGELREKVRRRDEALDRICAACRLGEAERMPLISIIRDLAKRGLA
jgi:hypothetical protein